MNPLLSEDPLTITELITYADDLALLTSGENYSELVNHGNKLFKRAQQRKLNFYATKSQTHWLMGSLSKPLDLQLGETKIKPTTGATRC